MKGLDTNVLVRLLVNDDKKQAAFAARIIEHNPVFISKTVLLETEWVLRYTYDLDSNVILEAFQKLLGLDHITVEDPVNVMQALHWYEDDMDFADALHLATNPRDAIFVTFDKKLLKKMEKLEIATIERKEVAY